MKTYFIFFHILILSCIISCSIEERTDDIVVSFYTYDFERSIALTPLELKAKRDTTKPDTIIYIPKKTFLYYCKKIENCKAVRKLNGKDCRINIKYKNKDIYVSHHCPIPVADINCNDVDIDITSIYKVLCFAQYFNHFSEEDLAYTYFIQKYGYPKDYHYIKKETKEIIYAPNSSPYKERRVISEREETGPSFRKVILRTK